MSIFHFLDDKPAKPKPPLLEWEYTAHKLPWGVILMLGGGFAIAEACKVTQNHHYCYSKNKGHYISRKILKGGYRLLTKCKSFPDAFIIQICGNNRQLDYATPRSTNCACSSVFRQNDINAA